MSLRTGLTTGTCAAAAAKAAVLALTRPVPAAGDSPPTLDEVTICLPAGQQIQVPILAVRIRSDGQAATAAVRKDAGDDPDITDGLEVQATVSWEGQADIVFAAGEGIGTVTKPGLQVAPGEPAINPVPRQMISAAIREVTPRGVRVELAIPGGREIATQTFNPRLGITGGLSILGTTGIVRPYCLTALREALKCGLDVAAACGEKWLVLVPGNIGARAARRHFRLRDEQVVEAGNEWGYVLDQLSDYPFDAVLAVGHPGKLVKLADGQWDTHSARSQPPLEILRRLLLSSGMPTERAAPEASTTVEGCLAALPPEERKALADRLAELVRRAVAERTESRRPIAVCLVSMAGECWGTAGDLSPWK